MEGEKEGGRRGGEYRQYIHKYTYTHIYKHTRSTFGNEYVKLFLYTLVFGKCLRSEHKTMILRTCNS
jgi:hypothetical protein